MNLDLDAIEARANAATSGPWYRGRADRRYEDPKEVYTRENMDAPESYDVFPNQAVREEDAEFVAQARTDVPALIAEVRRLRQRPSAPAVLSAIEALRPEMGPHINVSEYRRGKDDALILARAAVLALFPPVDD